MRDKHLISMVPWAGLEPATSRLGGGRSILLSYQGKETGLILSSSESNPTSVRSKTQAEIHFSQRLVYSNETCRSLLEVFKPSFTLMGAYVSPPAARPRLILE